MRSPGLVSHSDCWNAASSVSETCLKKKRRNLSTIVLTYRSRLNATHHQVHLFSEFLLLNLYRKWQQNVHFNSNALKENPSKHNVNFNTFFYVFRLLGSVYVIRRWTIILMGLLLLILPLLITCFPARPEPYKVSIEQGIPSPPPPDLNLPNFHFRAPFGKSNSR